MAERRMFAKTIIDSDAFLDMPQSTQLLYFHLSMRADDEGFINNPKSIMRNVKCCEDDLRVLATKKFIIPFESGIVVIKHWKIHNYIRKDTYTETKYKEEKSLLETDENGSYRINYLDPVTNERYVPYVVEPSLGADRVVLAFLTDAYDEEVVDAEKNDIRTVMRFHPALAPYKCAVLPLQKNLSEKAVFLQRWMTCCWCSTTGAAWAASSPRPSGSPLRCWPGTTKCMCSSAMSTRIIMTAWCTPGISTRR